MANPCPAVLRPSGTLPGLAYSPALGWDQRNQPAQGGVHGVGVGEIGPDILVQNHATGQRPIMGHFLGAVWVIQCALVALCRSSICVRTTGMITFDAVPPLPISKEAQEPPAPASAAPLGFAAPTEWSDTLCAASPWRVLNSALPPNGSYLATLPAHVR